MDLIVLRMPVSHPVVHLWIGSEDQTRAADVWVEEPEYLHVGLNAAVEDWCIEHLTRMPWFIPDRYVCHEFPDAQYVLSPLAEMLPTKYVRLNFACEEDAFFFKLRWW